MVLNQELSPQGVSSLAISNSSTVLLHSGRSSTIEDGGKPNMKTADQGSQEPVMPEESLKQDRTALEKSFDKASKIKYSNMAPRRPKLGLSRASAWFSSGGKLRPFRLLRQDVRRIRQRYLSDWTLFNQLVFASAVYVFFTNLLPGITFASDLHVFTGMTWGTIEVVFSTGLCGIIFAL